MTPIVGQEVNIVENPPSPTSPTETSTWFVAGTCEKGSITAPIKITSMAEKDAKLGSRAGGITLHDALDLFFGEGGQVAWVSRVVGTAPIYATLPLYDAAGSLTADTSLTVTAKSPGSWGNSLTVQVTDGDDVNSFKLLVRSSTDPSLAEDSPSLNSIASAIQWAQQTSAYIDLVAGASPDLRPRIAAAANLTTGTDDSGTIADAHWQTALDRITADYGAGQVSAPGGTTIARQTQLLQHAKDRNRFAILDFANTGVVGTLVSAALAVRVLANKLPRWAFNVLDWHTIPGVAGGQNRTAPGSAFVAGVIARSDASGKSPNAPAGGANGLAQYSLGPAQSFTDAQIDTLSSAGLNPVRKVGTGNRLYGYRTAVDSISEKNWLLAGNIRLLMAIKASGYVINERYVLKEIDGKGGVFKDLEGDYIALLEPYKKVGSLITYTVDTTTVNTPTTISNRQINASIDVQPAGMGEKVRINISKSPIA